MDALKAFTEVMGSGYTTGDQFNLRGGRFSFWRNRGVQFVVFQGKVVGIFAWRRYSTPEAEKVNAELQKY